MTLIEYRETHPCAHGNLCYNCAKYCPYEVSMKHGKCCDNFIEFTKKKNRSKDTVKAIKKLHAIYGGCVAIDALTTGTNFNLPGID